MPYKIIAQAVDYIIRGQKLSLIHISRDGRTMLQKKLLAYCPQDCGGLFEGRDMYAELDDMRHEDVYKRQAITK